MKGNNNKSFNNGIKMPPTLPGEQELRDTITSKKHPHKILHKVETTWHFVDFNDVSSVGGSQSTMLLSPYANLQGVLNSQACVLRKLLCSGHQIYYYVEPNDKRLRDAIRKLHQELSPADREILTRFKNLLTDFDTCVPVKVQLHVTSK